MAVERDGARIRTRTRLRELPEGVADLEQERAAATVRRLPNGRAATAEDARALARLPRVVNRERSKFASRLPATLGPLPPRLLAEATNFTRSERRRLGTLVGGGWCGPAPSSMIASAALALAASRYAYEHGDFALGSRLGVDSRQHLLAAHELCAREAEARRKASPPRMPWELDDQGEPEHRDTLHAPPPAGDDGNSDGDGEEHEP
jgi:hypothetical protein